MAGDMCSVEGCPRRADYEVIFYDVYLHHGGDVDIYYERHNSCPYICQGHLNENERRAETGLPEPELRKYRDHVRYPYASSMGLGFVIYRPL